MNESTVSTVAQLRELYGYPAPDALASKIVLQNLDRHHRAFIALSPFMMLATADAAGRPDVSPRGDLPGFVHCGKALIRSRLWAPPHVEENRKALPSLGKMLSDQVAGITAADAEARIDVSYTKRLWDEPPA